jgi:hypothetical protein
MEWSVLDWNEPAIGFYRSLGARQMDEWTVFRVTGEALEALAAGAGADDTEAALEAQADGAREALAPGSLEMETAG